MVEMEIRVGRSDGLRPEAGRSGLWLTRPSWAGPPPPGTRKHSLAKANPVFYHH